RDFHVTGVQTCALPICETVKVTHVLLEAVIRTLLQNRLGPELERLILLRGGRHITVTKEVLKMVIAHKNGVDLMKIFLEVRSEEIGRASCRERMVIS